MGTAVDVLQLLTAFTDESCYTVWESLVTTLNTFNMLFSYTDFYDSFRAFALEILSPALAKVGWESRETDSEYPVTAYHGL